MTPVIFCFFVGGVVVSLFAILGDPLKPKSFAGLFGAAPSIAPATLGLTIVTPESGRVAELVQLGGLCGTQKLHRPRISFKGDISIQEARSSFLHADRGDTTGGPNLRR